MADENPKSAVELAMERFRKQDVEAGVVDTPLSVAQREAIAEIRRVHAARVAERMIMHDSSFAALLEPAERAEREAEVRRDLDRFDRERDEKIKRIRGAEGG